MESTDSSDPSPRREMSAGGRLSPRSPMFAVMVSCCCFWMGLWWCGPGAAWADSAPVGVASFAVASADELVRTLDEGWGDVAFDGSVALAMAPSQLPRGLDELPVRSKKRAFLRALLPLAVSVNAEIARERTQVIALAKTFAPAGTVVTAADTALIAGLAAKYRVADAADALARGEARTVLAELLIRVDQVPVSLALAQGALESGWGTSRFAVEGNSLFGQWVFSGKGMTPAERPAGARHGVARFADLRASVAAYMRNLNSSWAYRGFRLLRAQMRAGQPNGRLDSLALAGELLQYSIRREAYVDEVRMVIRGNRLTRFDGARLLPLAETIAGSSLPPEIFAAAVRRPSAPPDA